jgi:hypothetical protein
METLTALPTSPKARPRGLTSDVNVATGLSDDAHGSRVT